MQITFTPKDINPASVNKGANELVLNDFVITLEQARFIVENNCEVIYQPDAETGFVVPLEFTFLPF